MKASPAGRVTVLFGDPRLGDPTKVDSVFSPEDLEAIERVKAALEQCAGFEFDYVDEHRTLVSDLARLPPAFVLNFCDTGYGNDPTKELHVPALLELLGVPYTGSGPTALSLCYDKGAVRALAAAHGVPVPEERYVGPDEPDPARDVDFPALVKPCRGDGSFGITRESVVSGPDQLRVRLQALAVECPGRGALVQEFLPGGEYSIGLVGNPESGFSVLPALEVDYAGLDPELPRILAYESKTVADSPYWQQLRYRRAGLGESETERLVAASTLLFERLQCRDYARFDFRADRRGEIKLLEVNPNPAWCWDGKLNLMAEFGGMAYSELLELLLRTALRRVGLEDPALRRL